MSHATKSDDLLSNMTLRTVRKYTKIARNNAKNSTHFDQMVVVVDLFY